MSLKKSESPPRRSGRYSEEFKRDAVTLVLAGDRSVVDVANSLGIVEQTLGNWVRQARVDRGDQEGLTTDERARMRELERECARLRTERELLKRAVAFWVKESTP